MYGKDLSDRTLKKQTRLLEEVGFVGKIVPASEHLKKGAANRYS
jgi:hypothetical protein